MPEDSKRNAASPRPDPFALREAPLPVDPREVAPLLVTSHEAGDPGPLYEMAIELWRLQTRLGRLRELVAEKELRPVESSVSKMEEVLRRSEIQVEDLTGRPYHEGDTIEVRLFEPSPQLARPVVVQTVKPSVLHRGRVVRQAEVIVGVPASSEEGR